jgi:restriction system protein
MTLEEDAMSRNTETTCWGIHAGKTGDGHTLFLDGNCIAIGWREAGDLRNIKADRESFKAKMKEVYPDRKPAALPSMAGQPFRFIHEIEIGDVVIYPSKHDRKIHLGNVTGDYEFKPSKEHGYSHVRAVKWVRALPRTHFSQGALYEIGSALSLFQVKNYADEFRAAMQGHSPNVVPVEQDESVAAVAEEIEETTHDFILKRLAQELKGHPFASFVAQLLNMMGYRTRVSPEGADGGVDIVAHKDELGFEPPIIKVQVKGGEGNIGDPTVSALYGKFGAGEYGLFVTLGSFTPPARAFGKSKSNLRLIDGDELVELILLHYDRFDSRYKGLLPLRRVYVPEAMEIDE